MDIILGIGLVAVLLLRGGLQIILRVVVPGVRRHWKPVVQRLVALVDIIGGAVMLGLFGLILLHQAWVVAAFWVLLAVPNVLAMVRGFRMLMDLTAKDRA